LTHKNVLKNFQLAKTFLILRNKVEAIREVLHFENGIEHKILITHVIAKISICQRVSKGRLKTGSQFSDDFL